jgi:hypothetical protein
MKKTGINFQLSSCCSAPIFPSGKCFSVAQFTIENAKTAHYALIKIICLVFNCQNKHYEKICLFENHVAAS